jgi:hypothetical protein
MEKEFAFEWLFVILRCMACQMNAAELFHILKTLFNCQVTPFNLLDSCTMLDDLVIN